LATKGIIFKEKKGKAVQGQKKRTGRLRKEKKTKRGKTVGELKRSKSAIKKG